jgi:hypothetical protein
MSQDIGDRPNLRVREEAYEDRTGPDYDALLDEAAQACTSDNEPELIGRFGRPESRVPVNLIV